MTRHDKVIFENDIQRHLEEMDGDEQYEHLSGEEAYALALEKAEMAYDENQDRLHEERTEKDWE